MKFPDCDSCANRDTDPAVCRNCDNASNYQPEDQDESVAYVSLDEFVGYFKASAQ